MEGIHLLCDLLQPNNWLGKIDLKDTYFVVPIWEKHQKFLRFVWKESLMEFACLPFGLVSAPRVFTKLMKPVTALLLRLGIRLIIYLDNILFMNQTPSGLLWDMSTASLLLDNLGFIINQNKSVFTPSQTLELLGFQINTVTMTLVLPKSRFNQESLHSSKGAKTSDCSHDVPLDRETDSFHSGNFPCSTAL